MDEHVEVLDLDATRRNGHERYIKRHWPQLCDPCVREATDEVELLIEENRWPGWWDYLKTVPAWTLAQALDCGCCDHGDPEEEHLEPTGGGTTTDFGRTIALRYRCKRCKTRVEA